MPSSGRATPLPSFTPERRAAGSTSSTSLPDFSNALTEKLSLRSMNSARAGAGVGRGWITQTRRRVTDLFVPLRIHVGRRTLVFPVFKVLHPVLNHSGKEYASLRKDGRVKHSLIGGGNGGILAQLRAIVGTWLVIFVLLGLLGVIVRPMLPSRRSLPFAEQDTLILSREEVQRVWEWEIASGRYPSRRRIGNGLVAGTAKSSVGGGDGVRRVQNPGIPVLTAEELRVAREKESRLQIQSPGTSKSWSSSVVDEEAVIIPVGPPRSYLSIQPRIDPEAPVSSRRLEHQRALAAYPPRPTPFAALDLDVVMDHCDFSENKYVRDCLEVLRMNGGLDPGLRRGDTSPWRGHFLTLSSPDQNTRTFRARQSFDQYGTAMSTILASPEFPSLVQSRQQLTLSTPPSPKFVPPHPTHPTADKTCDPDYPRIFHIFWAGPFTDKPYSATLSFLFTQRLSLETPIGAEEDQRFCRPQLWIWINPGPASSLPDPNAHREMVEDLKKNPWSAPFLHRRFEDVVKFRLWNTTEQLDAVEEMDGWREMRLFNSGGVKYGAEVKPKPSGIKVAREAATLEKKDLEGEAGLDVSDTSEDFVVADIAALDGSLPQAASPSSPANATTSLPPKTPKSRDELFERVGSSSSKGYDRLSVVLSDMARFVLTHRFGGVYLDADTILLRDWEELWGWHGAFAYRWSRLEKYNTAVLKMQRGSALGNFIFRTAVANGLDFHPMTVSRYTKDAGLEGLLLRLPDALFDPAWLNTEYYQRDRPPFPYFKQFEDFFETPKDSNAAPITLGFDGFFKGAYSYHFHNFWWIPFDPSRNFPDLGPRFSSGERIARGRLLASKLASQPTPRLPLDSQTGLNLPSPTKPAKFVPASQPTSADGLDKREGPRWGDDEEVDFEALDWSAETVEEDARDLSWSTVLKRTFESFVRGERANMYGEWISWETDGDE